MGQIGDGIRDWERRIMEEGGRPETGERPQDKRATIYDKDFFNMMYGKPDERKIKEKGEDRGRVRSMYEADWRMLEGLEGLDKKEKQILMSRYFGEYMKMLEKDPGRSGRRVSIHPSMLKFMEENPALASQMLEDWKHSALTKKENEEKDPSKQGDREQKDDPDSYNNNSNKNPNKNTDNQDTPKRHPSKNDTDNDNKLDPYRDHSGRKSGQGSGKFPRTVSFSHRDDNNQWEDSGEGGEDLANLMSNHGSQGDSGVRDLADGGNVFKDRGQGGGKDRRWSGDQRPDRGQDGRNRNNTAITPTQPIFNLSGVEDLGNSRANSYAGLVSFILIGLNSEIILFSILILDICLE